ncbi:MAG: NmrA family NAD(P)-binding protein, partial [Candidatus Kapaibacterium sp.]
AGALDGVDRVFLLRPPQLSDVDKYFRPFVEAMQERFIRRVLFISVQGAQRSNIIPHRKIEKLLMKYGLDYIFLRPGYFMQNLTTTLYSDIRDKRKIILPAGEAVFNWVDIENIAEAAAIMLTEFDQYKNSAEDITGYENMTFAEAAGVINSAIDGRIEYENTNLFSFFRIKRREGLPSGMILVMIMLHLLPRFQSEPEISNFYEKLTGKMPNTLRQFVEREKEKFLNS